MQFAATISRLSTLSARLAPLPPDCTFTLVVELRDDAEPPLGSTNNWIAADAGMQRRKGDAKGQEMGRRKKVEEKVVPVRKVEAGAFAMEVWMEEAAAKEAMVAELQHGTDEERKQP